MAWCPHSLPAAPAALHMWRRRACRLLQPVCRPRQPPLCAPYVAPPPCPSSACCSTRGAPGQCVPPHAQRCRHTRRRRPCRPLAAALRARFPAGRLAAQFSAPVPPPPPPHTHTHTYTSHSLSPRRGSLAAPASPPCPAPLALLLRLPHPAPPRPPLGLPAWHPHAACSGGGMPLRGRRSSPFPHDAGCSLTHCTDRALPDAPAAAVQPARREQAQQARQTVQQMEQGRVALA